MSEIVMGVLAESWFILNEASPYVLLGFLAAGLMKMWVPDEFMKTHLGSDTFLSVVKSSILGVPLPLCSCGVLPAAAGLKKQGASKGAVTAFMISTPETGVDSMAVTWALIEPVMMIIRPVAAFVTATVAGILVNLFPAKETEHLISPEMPSQSACGCEACGCGEQKRPLTLKERLKSGLNYAFGEMIEDIGIWMLAGVGIAGLISYFMPTDFIETHIRGEFMPLLIMLIIGMPLYVCATASTPIAASLLLKGLSPGAALVFLLAGPATNGATVTVLLRVLGKKATALYLFAIAFCSLLLGWMTNRVYDYFDIDIVSSLNQTVHHESGLFSIICTVVFFLLIVKSMITNHRCHTKGTQ